MDKQIFKLNEVCKIILSNVDKKIYENEEKVLLCNYTDVYNNWAITNEHKKLFMKATATKNEINKFQLKKGMVAITKDSEKRDDIGISTYIADNLDGTILGYHNALMIPDLKKLNGKFLNAYLHTLQVRKHFSNNASGSGQRYTLSVLKIGALNIKLPNINEQKNIGNIFSLIDKKIQLNNKINNELEKLAKFLYNYWFVQFDFPDENGRPYKSSGGEMVYNEELQREIPKGWEVANLKNNHFTTLIPVGVDYFYEKKYLATSNVVNEKITDGSYIQYDTRENRANMQPVKNSIWFAKMQNSIKHITLPENSKWFINQYILSTGFIGFECKKYFLSYFHCYINTEYFEYKKNKLSHGATQKAVNNSDLVNIPLIIPNKCILKKFSSIVYDILQYKLDCIKQTHTLISLRDFLLPLLMNGQAVINDE